MDKLFGGRAYLQPAFSFDFTRDPAERRRQEQEQLKQQALLALPGILSGRPRTAAIPPVLGAPGLPPVERAETEPESQPVVRPGETRSYTGLPTLFEALQAAQGTSDPAVRAALIEMVTESKLPTEPEKPLAVQEAEKEAREARGRERQIGAITPAMREGATPEERARAAVEGGREFQPPPSETETIVQNGMAITRNRRTGEPIGLPRPLRSAEEEAERTGTRALIPQYEREFETGVKAGIYQPAEVQVGRQLLARAKVTGDPGPFLTFAGGVAKAREAEASRKAGMRPERGPRTRESVRAVAVTEQNRAQYQTSVNNVASELTRLGVLKADALPFVVRLDGTKEPKTEVIEKAYAVTNPGLRIQVSWDGRQFTPVRVWEILETRDLPGTPEEVGAEAQ